MLGAVTRAPRRWTCAGAVAALGLGLAAPACEGRGTDAGVLAGYALRQRLELPFLGRNASGVAFHPQRGTLFVVTHKPSRLHEMTLAGELVRVVELRGFHDTEAVAWTGGDGFVVAEERARCLRAVRVPPEVAAVDAGACLRLVFDPDGSRDNHGYEALAFDLSRGLLWIGKEKDPRVVFRVEGFPAVGGDLVIERWLEVGELIPELGDVADMHFDSASGRLLILSEQSRLMVAVDDERRVVGRLALGSREEAGEPEGVTMDAAGRIYVVGEPSSLSIFERGAPAAGSGPANTR
jgi:uncharacterized protein YjiK